MLSRAFITLALVAVTLGAPIASGGDSANGNIGSLNHVSLVDAIVHNTVDTLIKDNANNNQVNAGILSNQYNHQKRTGGGSSTDGNILSGISVDGVTAALHNTVNTAAQNNLNNNQVNAGVGSNQCNVQKRTEGSSTNGNILSGISVDGINAMVHNAVNTWVSNNLNNNQVNAGILSNEVNHQKRTGGSTTNGNILSGISIDLITAAVHNAIDTTVKDNLNNNQVNAGILSNQVNHQKRTGDSTNGNILSGISVDGINAVVHNAVTTWVSNNLDNNQVNAGVLSNQVNHQKRTGGSTTNGNILSGISIDLITAAVHNAIDTTVKDNLNNNQVNAGILSNQVNHQKRTGDSTNGNILSGISVDLITAAVHNAITTTVKDNLNNNQVNAGILSNQGNHQ